MIRRELDEVLDELPISYRMRREVEYALDHATSPASLWRTMDQILASYLPDPVLRHRVERIFDRAFSELTALSRDPYFRGSHFGGFGEGNLRGWYDAHTGGVGFGDGYFNRGFDTFGRGFGDGFNRGFDTFGRGFGDTHSSRGFDTFGRGFGDTYYNRGFDTFGRNFGDGLWGRNFGDGFWGRNFGDTYGRSFRTPFSPYQLGSQFGFGTALEIPSVDIIEREHDIIVRAGMPGVRDVDIDVRVTSNDVLTIRAQRRDGALLTRTVPLPHTIDASRVQAFCQNGILEVLVPRLDAVRAQRVPVVGGAAGVPFRTNGIGSAYAS